MAGLVFSDRLRKSAAQAGFDQVCFVESLESNGGDLRSLSGLSGETCLVLLKPGYLPNTPYLACLRTLEHGQFVVGKGSPVLVCRTKEPGEWLKKNAGSPTELFSRFEKDFPIVSITEGAMYTINSADQIPPVEKLLFQALVKDTEGFMSKHLERKISLAISRCLVDTPISPNQMTVISVLIGIVGAVFMGVAQGGWQVAGAFLFLAHSILDGCDGELARIRFQQSRFGGLLDYWGDNVVHSAVFLALSFEWSRRVAAFYPYLLGGLAVFGTLASASWIYWKTMRQKPATDPLYVSVSTSREKSRVVEVADFLSRRDFIYLVLVLAIFQKLDWFLALSAAGAPFFFLVLLWIHFQEKPAFS